MPEEIEDTGGSLADAIAEHLALKKDHGGDATEIDHELEEALAPPTREVEPAPAAEIPPTEVPVEAPPVEVPPAPEPSVPEEPVEPPSAPEPEPDPEPVATTEPEPEPAPEPEPTPEPTAQTETTGTIEFEWDKPEEKPADMSGADSNEHDLLEDTPDFFEETPEHDKLWFDEAPPRKFEF